MSKNSAPKLGTLYWRVDDPLEADPQLAMGPYGGAMNDFHFL